MMTNEEMVALIPTTKEGLLSLVKKTQTNIEDEYVDSGFDYFHFDWLSRGTLSLNFLSKLKWTIVSVGDHSFVIDTEEKKITQHVYIYEWERTLFLDGIFAFCGHEQLILLNPETKEINETYIR
jgi:hypothetical protein